jgi:hypothetical protein
MPHVDIDRLTARVDLDRRRQVGGPWFRRGQQAG